MPGAARRGASPLALRTVRLGCEEVLEGVEGARARRGVTGVFPFAAVRVLASVGFRGRELFGVFRSRGILQGGREKLGEGESADAQTDHGRRGWQ